MEDDKLLWKLLKKVEKIPAERWGEGSNVTYHDFKDHDVKGSTLCSETLYQTNFEGITIKIIKHNEKKTRYSMEAVDSMTYSSKSFVSDGDEFVRLYQDIKNAHDAEKKREEEERQKRKALQERAFEDKLWKFAEKD